MIRLVIALLFAALCGTANAQRTFDVDAIGLRIPETPTGPRNFSCELSSPATVPMLFRWFVSGQSTNGAEPASGADFVETSGFLLFPVGTSYVEFDVEFVFNDAGEPEERFLLTCQPVGDTADLVSNGASQAHQFIAGAGDADLDGDFDGADLSLALSFGTYNTGLGAGWRAGDWTGDRLFTGADLVLALQAGWYQE